MRQIKNEVKRYNYLSSEINALYHEATGRCLQSCGISRQTINSAIRNYFEQGQGRNTLVHFTHKVRVVVEQKVYPSF